MENTIGTWFKRPYIMDGEIIRPLPGGKEGYYDPFDFYNEGNRSRDNLHHIFASIDTDDSKQMVSFYNNYGPLGIIGRDIMKITRPYINEGKQTGLLVVLHDSDDLIPVAEFMETYDVPVGEFGSRYIDSKQIPSILDVSLYAGESVEKFTYQQRRFRWILDMLTALFLKDEDKVSQLLKDQHPAIKELMASANPYLQGKMSDTEKLASAMEIVVKHINAELANRTSVKVSSDTANLTISKQLEWSFDSLLTALYMMVLMDIQRGVISRSCEECGRYFETNRSDIQYCSTKCQSRTNTRKHRELRQLINEMFEAGRTAEEIAEKTGREVSLVESWIQAGGKAVLEEPV